MYPQSQIDGWFTQRTDDAPTVAHMLSISFSLQIERSLIICKLDHKFFSLTIKTL